MVPRLMTISDNPDVSNWEWDNGYGVESNEKEYPLRVSEPGPAAGLDMFLIAYDKDSTANMCNV